MLYITDNGKTFNWHVGEPLPEITGRVVTFQADCDELGLILEAMRQTDMSGYKVISQRYAMDLERGQLYVERDGQYEVIDG